MISLKEVKHLSLLARLGLSGKEIKALQKDLEGILAYVEQLERVEVRGIKPVSHITGLENVGREDEVSETLAGADKVIRAVPIKEGRWVKVAKILKRAFRQRRSAAKAES